jgi:hypothetical protein
MSMPCPLRGAGAVNPEHTPSMLKLSTTIPLGGAGAGDPGASTINAKNHRRRGPWEVSEL